MNKCLAADGKAVVHTLDGVGLVVSSTDYNKLVAQRNELLTYAKCEDARSRGEDIAETVLTLHGFDRSCESAQQFMDRMRNAAIAKATKEQA